MYQAGKQWNNLPDKITGNVGISFYILENLQKIEVVIIVRLQLYWCFVNTQFDYLLFLLVIVYFFLFVFISYFLFITCICRLCKLLPCQFYVPFAFKRAFARLRCVVK